MEKSYDSGDDLDQMTHNFYVKNVLPHPFSEKMKIMGKMSPQLCEQAP